MTGKKKKAGEKSVKWHFSAVVRLVMVKDLVVRVGSKSDYLVR